MGGVFDETTALFLEVEGVLDEHGTAVAALALRLAELIDNPGMQAVAPLAKQWRESVDHLRNVLDAHRSADETDPAEIERSRLAGLRSVG